MYHNCVKCPAYFTRKDNLNEHIRVSHSYPVQRWDCTKCASTFSRERDRARHQKIYHSIMNRFQRVHAKHDDANDETNSFDFPVYDARLKHPFTCVVAGPTGSGKSHLIREIIEAKEDLIYPSPTRVIWSYGIETNSTKMAAENASQDETIEYIAGIPDETRLTPGTLLVIDDLMAEADKNVTKLFTKISHHKDISIFFLVQNIFHKNKEMRTISENSHYVILFKNPRNVKQVTYLAMQMAPNNIGYVQSAYQQATAYPHGYLLFDFKQNTPDEIRLRSKLLPWERNLVYRNK